MRKTLFAILLALALVMIPVGSAFAATTANVTVTATPEILSFTNAPDNWPINTGSLLIRGTTYYSNPLGETTDPGAAVIDGECRFDLYNEGDIALDINMTFPAFTGGAAWANSDTGNATTVAFGASAYLSGGSTPGTTLLSTGTTDVISNLATVTHQFWGLRVATPTDPATDNSPMSAIVVLTAEVHI